MPRRPYKYHYIYKTTNQVNGKFYIGMHSTDNLEDGYIGSGKMLWLSIRKYGRENFRMEILEYLPNRKSLGAREKEIVNRDLVGNSFCMNIKLGGEYSPGTFGKKYSDESRLKMSQWKRPKELGEKISKKLSGKKLSEEHCISISKGKKGKPLSEENKKKVLQWQKDKEKLSKACSKGSKGRVYSEEAKQNMRKPRSEEGKANMRKPKIKGTCPHCGKQGGMNQLKRWHFDNCPTLQ